eukprot:GHVT01019558.1.p1 GENE.GHVT01019558.1~~GHVT01019558.1.p1  ORF type:complete len:250 (-),score=20.68 GHVT01019558.1:1053-1802(-)
MAGVVGSVRPLLTSPLHASPSKHAGFRQCERFLRCTVGSPGRSRWGPMRRARSSVEIAMRCARPPIFKGRSFFHCLADGGQDEGLAPAPNPLRLGRDTTTPENTWIKKSKGNAHGQKTSVECPVTADSANKEHSSEQAHEHTEGRGQSAAHTKVSGDEFKSEASWLEEPLTAEAQALKEELVQALARRLSGPLADNDGNVPTGQSGHEAKMLTCLNSPTGRTNYCRHSGTHVRATKECILIGMHKVPNC